MKETYDLFKEYVKNLENGKCECSFGNLGLVYEETSTRNDPAHEIIYGIKLEEVKKMLKKALKDQKATKNGSEKGDER